MYQAGKMDNIEKEMRHMDIKYILGISELRWTRVEWVKSEKIDVIYSGGDKLEKGVGIMLDERMI